MPDTEHRLRAITAEILDADPRSIAPVTRFVDDLGAGSLETVELLIAFEDQFGIEIPDDVVETLGTFGAAVNYIRTTRTRAGSAA
ncbi:acyl carrier protein [Defluviimonas sp. WL0024]|uniref:Acyl carrier protein n=1 Tax=Albidovulum salinarum TaxID=2984153 RepID=A0ABT2X9L9_9RHOB|nr:acyl carrier protein [Defluviimonas sp. WL0024]MCU9850444.1 acyl carrier protein [Defluviimonas sp. WL0024]